MPDTSDSMRSTYCLPTLTACIDCIVHSALPIVVAAEAADADAAAAAAAAAISCEGAVFKSEEIRSVLLRELARNVDAVRTVERGGGGSASDGF
jgi:hypothetical protein